MSTKAEIILFHM